VTAKHGAASVPDRQIVDRWLRIGSFAMICKTSLTPGIHSYPVR
jgi:hypothetical protein